MSFLITCLAFCNTVHVYTIQKWNEFASWLRRSLGPEPQNWILLADGRVISATTPIPAAIQESAYMFDIGTTQITKINTPNGRHRPLPILALQIQHPDVGSIDISDWIGEIRIFPQRVMSPRQIVELWGLVHNRYVPINNARAVITRDDGSVESVELV